MSKKPEPKPDPVQRRSVGLPGSLWEEVKIFRHAHLISSETKAIERLLRAGLAAELADAATSPIAAAKRRQHG